MEKKSKKIILESNHFYYKCAQNKINGIPSRRYLSGLLCCAYILSLASVPLFANFFLSSFPIQDLQEPGDIPNCLTDMFRIAIKAF
jgi:hypothetical protein